VLSKEIKELVGTDQLGNKYYYIPEYKNWTGQIIREKRFVEAANKNEIDYDIGNIPTEWEAWIRKTRKIPPTVWREKSSTNNKTGRIQDGNQNTATDLLTSMIQGLYKKLETCLIEVKHQGELKHQHYEPLAPGRPLHPMI
jgi:NADH:ubiquinone oxidoreductase subunit